MEERMSRLEGVDIDYLNRKFNKGDKKRGEARVLLALSREEGERKIKMKLKNSGLIIIGYLLSLILFLMGLFTNLFFSFVGFCLLMATISHHIWHNKIFVGLYS
jgi:hypothetical protein